MNRKKTAGFTAALVSVAAVMALVAPGAGAALNPGYTQFAGCPSPYTENPIVVFCNRSEIKSGHFQMGNKDVTIEKPMVMTWGADENTKGWYVNSQGGLSKAKQKVPGGIIGLTGLTWLLEFFGSEALTLYATTELAGTPNTDNPENITLPIKVHLEHSVLGSKCYVGSNSNPITLNLTTGTTSPPAPNKPITGQNPEISFDPELTILHFDNIKYVDNSFAAPGANGCTLTLFGFIPISINGLVNAQSGLPAAAGTNETIQNVDLEAAISYLAHTP